MGKNLKKIMAITLSFTLAVGITGCSKGSGKSSMGRYVEERYESPTNGYAQNLTTLEDGRIAMFGYSEETSKESAFISEDGGQTWTNESIELPKQEGKETYTNNIGYLNDGRILVSYYFADPYVEPSEDEGAVDDSLATEGEDSEIMNEGDYSYEEPEFKYAVIETDGTITDIDLDLESYNDGEESWGYNTFKCAPNGDVFFSAGSNVTGSLRIAKVKPLPCIKVRSTWQRLRLKLKDRAVAYSSSHGIRRASPLWEGA